MKRTPETKRSADTLPTFLDNQTEDTVATEMFVEGAESDPPPAEPEASVTTGEAENAAAVATEPASPPESAKSTASRRSRAQAAGSMHSSGKLGMGLGVATLLMAIATCVPTDLAAFAARNGVQPNILFVLGALLVAAGATQRHIGRLQRRLDDTENRRQADADVVHQNLQQLVDDNERSNNKAPAEGEDLQHVLLSLQRQDEKINNLTKAIKMYGKPLMEISGQSSDVTSILGTIKTLVEGGAEASRQTLARMETQLRTPTSNKELAELNGAVQKLAARIEALGSKASAVSLEPVLQQLGRLEVAIAAVAQRLEDTEVRKSLLRLEETSQRGQQAVQELLRGDSMRQATAHLQERVDTASKGLSDGLAQLRDGNLGALEAAVRDVQREVSGVATTVAQINAAVKSGVRSANVSAAAPTAPTPTPVTTPSPAAAPTGGTTEGGSGYQTGTRTTGSKNVLGAIAKLKQMKG